MIYYFFDTSAFVKLYAYEPGEREIRDILSAAVAPTPAAGILVCTRLYKLRGGDAVHLAAALAARASSPIGVRFRFVTTDQDQEAAAKAEGMDVYNPVAD